MTVTPKIGSTVTVQLFNGRKIRSYAMMDRRTFFSFCLTACLCSFSKLMNIDVRWQDKKSHTKTPGRLRLEEFWAEDR
jgi:hypothetical protein